MEKTNLSPLRAIEDMEIWVEEAEAKLLMVKSALKTMRAYVKEVEKDARV